MEIQCNGGNKEKRFTARNGDIDFTGTELKSIKHMTLASKDGCIKAANAKLTVTNQNLLMNAVGPCLDGSSDTVIDVSGAEIFADTTIRINAQTTQACTAANNGGVDCINAEGAMFTANSVKPRFNGDNTAPYDPNVLDDTAECGAGMEVLVPTGNGNVAIRTPGLNGVIDVCNAVVVEN